MSATTAPAPHPGTGTPVRVGGRGTRFLSIFVAAGIPVLLLFAFVLSPEDDSMRDAVRLLYIHVPVAMLAYVAFGLTAVGSVMYLWKRSRWWDTVAYSAAEVGVVFCGLTLVTGSIWGRPTWNTWWEWSDVRLVTTLVIFLVFVGYLAFRKVPADPDTRARRAAIIGIIGAINIPIVNRSVEWWENNTLHQQSSLTDGNLENLTLFTWFLGTVVLGAVFLWLLIARFRLTWLEEEVERHGLLGALEERRAVARDGVQQAVGGTILGELGGPES
ncbi:MAG: cytochrome c biogenesis protein CcsA [Acidimicrobiales bacterium]